MPGDQRVPERVERPDVDPPLAHRVEDRARRDEVADHLAVELRAVGRAMPQQVVAELKEEGLPVLATMLSSSVRIKESHQQAKPMIHLDRGHKLSLEFIALHDEIASAQAKRSKAAAKKRA